MQPQPTAILIPSLWRPDRLEHVLRSLERTTPEEHHVYVVVDRSDNASQRVAEAHGVSCWSDDAGWYPPRLQFLFEHSSEPWVWIGQDDNVFSADWLTGCFEYADDVAVVVPSDGHNANGTSLLTERYYVEEIGGAIGYPGQLYHPDYRHFFHENEFMETAESRGLLRRAPDVLVEHAHQCWGLAPDDATYQRTRPHWAHDEALYNSRRHLWTSVSA